MPSFPDPPPALADDVVALRLAAERDIPEILIAHQDDPGLAAALGEARPPSGAQLGRRVEESAAVRGAGAGLWLTITDGASDECRGQIEVLAPDWEQRRAGLLVWIAPADRGRGLGSAALTLLGRWLLRDAGLERVGLIVAPGDEALRRAATRAGFVAQDLLSGDSPRPRDRADAQVYALVAGEL